MSKTKTILFVALPYSVHTARWIAQLNGAGYEIHLFPSLVTPVHPKITGVTIHYAWHQQQLSDSSSHQQNLGYWLERVISIVFKRVHHSLLIAWRAKQLAKLIQRLQPNIVHAMEMQSAGYLTVAAQNLSKEKFPPWIMTIWGSDIYWYGRFSEHQEKIRQVLTHCDYFFCECERDVQLAKDFGFNKSFLPIFPATGGFELANLAIQRNAIKPSNRKVIALKGYQHWVGLALVGLQALEQCINELQGYVIIIYSATPNVVKAARLFTQQTGISTQILPNGTAHSDILALQATARVSIGLSLSDGMSNSLLEAIVMGSFPIQSCTACADEWIEHGISGAIVPAEEIDIIAMWIRKALSDDALVNQAADLNWQTALARLDSTHLTQKTLAIYDTVMQ